MPYTINNPPDKIKALPNHAKEIWITAFNAALTKYKDEEMANKVAWSAVGNKYEKQGDKWVVKKEATEKSFDEIISDMRKAAEMMFPISIAEMKFTDGANGEIKTEIQVLPVGTWKHPAYGDIKITETDVEEFIHNFEDNVRKDIPITEGHSVGEQELPAVGWFKQLINKGRDGLWATVEWTKEGMELLKNKLYKYFSPEFYSRYEDPETHKVYKNVLVGGALTNRPYFKGLTAVILSEMTLRKMKTLEEILKIAPADLADEEIATLKERAGELTAEQKETFKDALAEGDGGNGGAEHKHEEEKEEKEEEEEKEKVEGSEKITVSKKTMSFLEMQAKEGVKAMGILRKQSAEVYTKGMEFSESNKEGIFLPKSRDKVVSFILSLNETQQKAFKEIVGELPRAKVFSEIGKNGGGIDMKASEEVSKLIQDKMSKDNKLAYRQAAEQVMLENPDLAIKMSEE
jgi:cation transport regulator ChaB/phage I-like protein